MKYIIKEVNADQLPVVHELAVRIWYPAYSSILSGAQIDYMLEQFYSLPVLQKQMTEDHHVFLMVCEGDGTELGFAAIEYNYPVKGSTKIHKLYVLPDMQGAGLGRMLVEEIMERARRKGQSILCLNVNRYNKAVDFYKRLGFVVSLEEDIAIGHGFFMNDYQMELRLDQ